MRRAYIADKYTLGPVAHEMYPLLERGYCQHVLDGLTVENRHLRALSRSAGATAMAITIAIALGIHCLRFEMNGSVKPIPSAPRTWQTASHPAR